MIVKFSKNCTKIFVLRLRNFEEKGTFPVHWKKAIEYFTNTGCYFERGFREDHQKTSITRALKHENDWLVTDLGSFYNSGYNAWLVRVVDGAVASNEKVPKKVASWPILDKYTF